MVTSALFFFILLAASAAFAQFTCTLTNTDEASCLNAKGDDNDHCVWCSIAGYGVCVSEAQAEQMESTLPNAQCDRFSGSDDDTTPNNDDKAPDDDSVSPPSDDALPDNFEECLQEQDSKSCTSADCTWCVSDQYQFGICMAGPTAAEKASNSIFFDCAAPNDEEETLDVVEDPADTACLAAFVEHPTKEGCTSAFDSDGNPCQWCDWNGSTHLCLTKEQAESMSESDFDITCDKEEEDAWAYLRGRLTTVHGNDQQNAEDPWDPSCLLAYLQDPTEEACEAATDADGLPCLFCDLQGQAQLCLTEEQAQYGEQMGMTCSSDTGDAVEDPQDPTCALAYFQDPTPDGCTSATDQDGNACEYCTFQGQMNLCLNEEQAEIAKQFGIECSDYRDNSKKLETTAKVA